MKENVDDIRRARTGKLYSQGHAYLAHGEFTKALDTATKLEALCYSGAFELGALAYCELGDLDAAISYLRKGVGLAPQCWLNWQLLGTCLSDAELYEEAHAAYGQALSCADVWHSSVRLNQAIVANRCGDYAAALKFLNACEDPELLLHKSEAEVFSLTALGRLDEAALLAQSILDLWLPPPGTEFDCAQGEVLARIAASLGRVGLAKGGDVDEIRNQAIQYLYLDHANQSLLDLIREIDSLYSEHANYYSITVSCKLPEINNRYEGAAGYFSNYEVVADNIDEAMCYIYKMEDPDLRANILPEQVELVEPAPQDAKGVFCRSSRIYYERDD